MAIVQDTANVSLLNSANILSGRAQKPSKQKAVSRFSAHHPGPGGQGMIEDDIDAETKIAGATYALTDPPSSLECTVGDDGTWGARMWRRHGQARCSTRTWCEAVPERRSAGFRTNFADELYRPPESGSCSKRPQQCGAERTTRIFAPVTNWDL